VFRLVGPSEAIREAVPAELVPLVWVVTLLGSAKFLMVVLSLAYWNLEDRREDVLALVSVAFVALTATLALKYGFDLPRPPAAVQRYPVEPSPVGFPSGHAISATVVYGGSVVAFDRLDDPLAVGGAALAAVAIGLSRVVLGVHYLGDVLAGWAVGLAVLGLVAVVLRVRAGAVYGFGAAAVLSIPALVVTGGNPDAALALGGSVGGLVGTLARSPAPPFRTTAERVAVSAVGTLFVGAAVLIAETVVGLLAVTVLVNIALVVGIVLLPGLVGRFDALGPASRTTW
jgi:membrane-associated phospholipid phosphatase